MNRKIIAEELYDNAKLLYTKTKDKLHPKTRNKYSDLLIFFSSKENRNINSLKKLIRDLTLFEEVKESKNVTAKQLIEKKKETKTIKEQVVKFLTSQTRNRRLKERQTFDGAFHEAYIYGDEMTLNKNNMNVMIEHVLEKEFIEIKASKIKFSLKVYVTIKCLMQKTEYLFDGEEETTYKTFFYNGLAQVITASNNIKPFVNNTINLLYEKITDPSGGSNWLLSKILKVTISSQKFKSALGKSYIELHRLIKSKEACLNIKNNDNKCFDYCLKAFVLKDDKKIINSHHKNIPETYKKANIKIPLNIEYPVAICDIPLYEKLNNIQINVFS